LDEQHEIFQLQKGTVDLKKERIGLGALETRDIFKKLLVQIFNQKKEICIQQRFGFKFLGAFITIMY